ncbi:MAG: hypothetical protein J6J45_00385 [Clostridia bacterium]|nr:hypothetical protein [Clostridia bacterium]
MSFVISKEKLLEGVDKMNSFGTRLTGSPGQDAFVTYIKNEIKDMGLEVYSDLYSFDRWEAKESSIVIHNDNGYESIEVSSEWPYSGETPKDGITAEIVEIKEKHVGFAGAKNKIALVKVHDLGQIPTGVAFNQRNSFPEDLSLPAHYKGPVATAFVNFPLFSVAKKMGVKAIICIWQGMSKEMVKGQYLSFIQSYLGIPCLWVSEKEGEKLLSAAKCKQKVTLTLLAEKEKNAKTESFYSVIEGKNRKEAIIINTHTDGSNCVEENGPIAMLELMKYFKEKQTERTLIFAFVTGHFRLHEFKQNDIQASSKWLKNHRDMWDGKKGHIKAVAGVSVEHLGCTEWKDVDGVYQKTNDIDVELVYTGNKKMDEIYYESVKDREHIRTITLRGHNILHFGEGQPLRNVGIPEIALVTAPDYLTVISESHEMEKFNLELMYEQTLTFAEIINRIDATPADELGKPEPYTFGLGRVKNRNK